MGRPLLTTCLLTATLVGCGGEDPTPSEPTAGPIVVEGPRELCLLDLGSFTASVPIDTVNFLGEGLAQLASGPTPQGDGSAFQLQCIEPGDVTVELVADAEIVRTFELTCSPCSTWPTTATVPPPERCDPLPATVLPYSNLSAVETWVCPADTSLSWFVLVTDELATGFGPEQTGFAQVVYAAGSDVALGCYAASGPPGAVFEPGCWVSDDGGYALLDRVPGTPRLLPPAEREALSQVIGVADIVVAYSLTVPLQGELSSGVPYTLAYEPTAGALSLEAAQDSPPLVGGEPVTFTPQDGALGLVRMAYGFELYATWEYLPVR